MTVNNLIEMLTKLEPKTKISVWINGRDYDCDEEFDFAGFYVGSKNYGYSLEVKPQAEQEPKKKIITCKDCKHGRNGICPNYRDFIDDDFYCASAERN